MKNLTSVFLAVVVVLTFSLQRGAEAGVTLFWDGDGLGTQDGGAGTWNTTGTNLTWSTTDEGTTFQAWVNNAGDPNSAIFDDVAASVTVGTVTVNSITFSPNPSAAYTLTGGTITFAGANPTITVNTTGTTNTSLTSNYTGTGPITKMGAGRLELNNSSNTLSGGYIINQGFINLAAANRLGTGAANPGTLDPDWFTFGGGGLTSSNAGAQDLGATRGVTLAGSAWFGASAGNNPVTISAPITGTGSINIAGTGGSSPLNATFNSGMNLTLTNTANDWSGPINVTLGTLTVGAANVIPDATAISLTGSTGVGSVLALGANNETVGTVLVNGTGAAITGSGGILTATSYDLRASGTNSAILAGSGVVATKTTAGVVTLTGANTFNGGFNLNAGTVRAGNAAALGAANSAVTIANNTILATNSATNRTLTYAYTVNGNFTLGDATGTGILTMAGTVNLGSSVRTITIANASDTISGVVSGTGGIDKAGTGTLLISGNNTYDGATTISAGKLQSNNANALGTTVSNTQVTSGAELLFDGVANNFTTSEAIDIAGSGAGDGGAIAVQNGAKITLSGAVTLSADAALSTASGATATYSNANAITGTNTNLTLQGAGGSGTISGAVSLGSGGLTKNESGTWTLSNAAGNSYGGGTSITGGTLLANNTTGSATGSGSVLVSGTGTLAGTGNTDATGGAVTVNSGAHVRAGAGAASGTLTMPSLNLQSGGLLTATLGAPSNAAKVAVTDSGGATVDGALEIVTVNGIDDGTFRVLTYNGTRGGAGLQPSSQVGNGFDSITILDTGTSGFIDVTIAITKRQWGVDSDGNWVTGTNWTGGTGGAPTGLGSVANFLSTITSARTVTVDDANKTVGVVNFDNANKYTVAASGGNSLVIDTWGADGQINVTNGSHEISAPVTMNKNTSVTVANVSDTLTVSGNVVNNNGLTKAGAGNLLVSGVISGTGTLTNSAGTTTLSGTNTYTGRNDFNGGVVSVSTDLNLGAAPGAATNDMLVFNGGTLQLSSGFTALSTNRRITVNAGGGTLEVLNTTVATPSTYAGVISGSGTLTKSGAGILTLTSNNTGFAGTIALSQGTIGVGGNNIFGNTTASTLTITGGVLSNTATNGRTIPTTVSVNLNANFTADDSLFNSSTPGQILFSGPSTINNSNRTITVNGTANLALGGVVGQDVAGRSLTKDGAGILALTNLANAYSGSTTVLNGKLQVDADGSFGDGTGDINLNGGILNASASRTVTTPNPLHLNASAAITTTTNAATPQFNFGSNTITGVGGAVLTLRNDGGDAATDEFQVRFFGSGYNFSNNIDMPAGLAGSTTELSSFNTTGTTQTYSGVISGTGSFKRSASVGGTGGTTVLTAQNTFSGGTELNDGTIEFGVDSVGPANAPTSGPVGTGTITVNNINAPKLAAAGGARNVGNAIAFGGGSVMGITGSNNLTLSGNVDLGAGARTINVDNSGQSVMSGIISGAGGSLTKALGGVLTVTGSNTYDAGTTVSAGTLLVNNTSGSGTGSGAVGVSAGATLGGTGTISGAITNDGTIAPGASVGTLTTGAGVTMNASSHLAIELSGTNADMLVVGGNLNLSAVDFLDVTGAGTGSSWVIASYAGTLTGTFDNVTSGYTVNYGTGSNSQITLNAAGLPGDFNSDGKVDAGDYVTWRKNDGTNNALANDNGLGTPIGAAHYSLWKANFGNPPGAGSGGGVNSTAAVPEPSIICLLALGLMAPAFRRRR